MTDRKKPGWAFWATIIVAVVALYPLSMGPLAWLESRELLPQWSMRPLEICFTPIMFVANESESTGEALGWYVDLWKLPQKPKNGTTTREEIERALGNRATPGCAA